MRWAKRSLTPTPDPPQRHKLTLGARNWEDLFTTHFGKEPGEKGGVTGSGTPSIPPQGPENQDPHSTLNGDMWKREGTGFNPYCSLLLQRSKTVISAFWVRPQPPKMKDFKRTGPRCFLLTLLHAPCLALAASCAHLEHIHRFL